MFTKTKLVLSAAILLGTALTASAATTPQATQSTGSVVYNMIPGYTKSGSVVAIPDPDHYGQAQFAGDENPRRH